MESNIEIFPPRLVALTRHMRAALIIFATLFLVHLHTHEAQKVFLHFS